MASTNPPTIDTSAFQGAPAHEWAHDTTSALDPTYNQKPTLASKSSEPDVPGAYLSEYDVGQPGVDVNAAVGQVKEATMKVLNSAGEYLPSQEEAGNAASRAVDAAREYLPAKEQVQSVTQSVVDTAKQYLPEAVAAYFPGTKTASTSLPTTEKAGSQPGEKVGGAGALPGAVSESGVAVLPDERPVEAQSSHVAVGNNEGVGGTGGPLAGGVGYFRVSENEPGVAGLPLEKGVGGNASKRLNELKGGSGGIGTLSWAGSESSIAVLPDEKSGKNGLSPGHATPSRKSEVNDDHGPKAPVSDDALMGQHDRYSADYRPSELHPYRGSNGRAQVEQPSNGDTGKALPPSPTSSKDGSASTGHKPKFLDRVKGEAKIIAGKLGGNEEKVEEGKRLKGFSVE